MPQKLIRFAFSTLLLAIAPFISAQEAESAPSMTSPEKAEPVQDESFRSKAYDAAAIQSLYKNAKAKNEKRAAQMPDHINADNVDYIELDALRVEAQNIELNKDLVEKLSPRPRKRLERIAAFDPSEANIMMARVRGDQEFLNGTYDRGVDPNAGRTASFSHTQLKKGLDNALNAIRNAMGAKVPEEESDDPNQR